MLGHARLRARIKTINQHNQARPPKQSNRRIGPGAENNPRQGLKTIRIKNVQKTIKDDRKQSKNDHPRGALRPWGAAGGGAMVVIFDYFLSFMIVFN